MEIKSSKGDRYYSVTLDPDTCTCPAGIMGKECRHIRLAKHQGTMEINTNYLKFSGTGQEIGRTLKTDEEVVVIVQGSVVKIEQRSNQDGTVDMYYVVKPYSVSLGDETQEE